MQHESQLAQESWKQGGRSSILAWFFVFNCRMRAVAGAGSACSC
jgi:hypothetical protein